MQPISDPALLEQLESGATARTPVSDPKLLSQLEAPDGNQGSQDSYGLNLFREGLQGLTLGTSDEVGAAIAAGVAAAKDGANFKDAYSEILGSVNQEQNAFREENPKTALAAQVAGGVATGGLGLAKTVAKTAGKPLVVRAAAAGGVGATEGGIAGYAGAEGDDRATSGLVGATTGLILNAAGNEVATFFKNRSALKDEVSKLIASGSDDVKVARYMKDGAGKIVNNPGAISAIKQGVDEGVVATVKGAARSDRAVMRQMVMIAKRAKANAKFSATNRPSDAVGESLLKRIKVISKVNRQAGSQIDVVANSLKGKPANFVEPVDNFISELDSSLGVTLKRSTDGVITPDFSDAIIRNNPAAKKLLKNLIDEMQKDVQVDAFRAHRLKRIIDDQVEFGKAAKGFKGKTESIVKGFRRSLDQSLDAQFPAYKKVNDTYAETIGALNDIQGLAGSKIDLLGKNSEKALGTMTRSVLSNIKSRTNLLNSINDLDALANKLGGRFDDDVVTQVIFADELERLLGSSAKTSLAGTLDKTAERAARSGVKDALQDAAVDGIKAARGINEEGLFKALQELLKDAPGTELAL